MIGQAQYMSDCEDRVPYVPWGQGPNEYPRLFKAGAGGGYSFTSLIVFDSPVSVNSRR